MLARAGLGVGWQQHADAGAPSAEQRDGQFRGIVQVQGDAVHAASPEGGGQAQGTAHKGGVVHGRAHGNRTFALWFEEQPVEAQPAHASLRTRWRTSHSPANSNPISK